MLKKIEKFLASLALIAAKSACGAASEWLSYQHREPDSLEKFVM